METMILLLLLTLSDKNGSMKESINRFLCFYKENRDLIQTCVNMFSNPNGAKTENAPDGKPDFKYEENRPREEVGDLNILEEYLRRVNA